VFRELHPWINSKLRQHTDIETLKNTIPHEDIYQRLDILPKVQNFIYSKLHLEPAPHSILLEEELVTPQSWLEEDLRQGITDKSINRLKREALEPDIVTSIPIRLSAVLVQSTELPNSIRNRLIGGEDNNTEFYITNISEIAEQAQTSKINSEIKNIDSKSISGKNKRKSTVLTEKQFVEQIFTSTPTFNIPQLNHISILTPSIPTTK
jgi:hypothetical protein